MSWRDAIEENGFAIMPKLFSRECMDQLLAAINRLAPRRSRAGLRHAMRLSPVAGIARQAQMIELARTVLGPEAFPFRATLFDKSPQSNWLVAWHQDTALPLRSRRELPGWGPWSIKGGIDYARAPAGALSQVLAVRVSLDGSSADNGPLRVLPATHTEGLLTDDSIRDLATSTPSLDCIVPKGGILAIRPLLVHASSKAQADMPRRVLHIEYAAAASIAAPFDLAIA